MVPSVWNFAAAHCDLYFVVLLCLIIVFWGPLGHCDHFVQER